MTRRRLTALAAAILTALPFLCAGDVLAETAPAANLHSAALDLGNGWAQTVWLDDQGRQYDLGLVFRLPSPRPVPGIAVPVVYEGDAIGHASAAHRVSADFLRCLREKESEGDPTAVNLRGNWHGWFQYLPATWSSASARYGYRGAGIYDGWAQAHVTAAAIADHRGDYGWLRGQWPPSAFCGSPWA